MLKVKKTFLILASLFLATTILAISVVKTTAQTSTKFKVTPLVSVAVSPTPTPVAKVDYYLAYPGLLPDHFLYPLKMARDKILLSLTFDQVKKAQVLLLFADKRLGAGKALIEGGKVDLGVETLTKGEKYLEQAALEVEKAKKAGKNTAEFEGKLTNAALKHQEVLAELSQRVSSDAKSVLNEAQKYSQQVSAKFK